MADKYKMAKFYAQCQEQGYTDMRDETQSLKAKVIATDLGLNYGKIEDFYAKAEKAWQKVQEEKELRQREQAARDQAQAARKAKLAVDGALLVTMSDSMSSCDKGKVIRVYRRPDGSIYTTIDNGEKIEGYPAIKTCRGGVLQSTYHPSETVYTGVTVGGVTTGGFHQTQASVSERAVQTGTGYLQAKVRDQSIGIQHVRFSEMVCDAFRRDAEFRRLTTDGKMCCFNAAKGAQFLNTAVFAHTSGRSMDYGARETMLSMAADETRLPYETCAAQEKLLFRVVSATFPPTDEQLYKRACELSESERAADLKEAINVFTSISDYRDAKARAEAIRPRYAEQLQAEKEAAVLEKERTKKANKKNAIIAAIGAAVLAVLVCVGFHLSAVHTAKEIIENREFNPGTFENIEDYAYDDAKAMFGNPYTTHRREITFVDQETQTLQFVEYDWVDYKSKENYHEETYHYEVKAVGIGKVCVIFGDYKLKIAGYDKLGLVGQLGSGRDLFDAWYWD